LGRARFRARLSHGSAQAKFMLHPLSLPEI
jgi:hypothetical protein